MNHLLISMLGQPITIPGDIAIDQVMNVVSVGRSVVA
jgi:hypothetical protein